MRLRSVMCFSSSIICLLIVASHGAPIPGHRGVEHEGLRVNSSQHRHNYPTSPDLKSIINSSHSLKRSQKDPLYNEEYNRTYYIHDTYGRVSRNSSRKQRSAIDKIELPPVPQPVNSHPTQSSLAFTKSTHVDHSHQHHQHGASSQLEIGSPNYLGQNSNNKPEELHKQTAGESNHDYEDSDHRDNISKEGSNKDMTNNPSKNTSLPCYIHDDHDHENETSPSADYHLHHPAKTKNISLMVWVYSFVAVVIISLCGLLSVAVIPIMQKWFYHTLLQFLVGLAVGSLTGDGLLHLMPHAILDGDDRHDHNGHSHDDFRVSRKEMAETAIWRGLTTLGGIFLFFIAERILGAIAANKRVKKEAKLSRHTKNMIPVMQSEDGANNGNVGEKLAQPKKNSYDHIKEKDEKETIQMLQTEATPSRKGSSGSTHEVGFHGRSSFSLDPDMSVAFRPDSESSVIVSEHHGHGHGHSHDIPNSVSAVAMMVIMGDGFHNFCDGLAIGTAFASGVADGVSTTVAVFCHELPHELGDFAMLLKTGMTVKQALFYNGVSSILCLIGMIIGVMLGNVSSAGSWVFAGTFGMFIYIALVDMLPELTTGSESGRTAITTLAVQVLGIFMGICIMLLIAVYEHKLHKIVS